MRKLLLASVATLGLAIHAAEHYSNSSSPPANASSHRNARNPAKVQEVPARPLDSPLCREEASRSSRSVDHRDRGSWSRFGDADPGAKLVRERLDDTRA